MNQAFQYLNFMIDHTNCQSLSIETHSILPRMQFNSIIISVFLGPALQCLETDTVPAVQSGPGRRSNSLATLHHRSSENLQNVDKNVPGVASTIRNCAATNLVGGGMRATLPTSSPCCSRRATEVIAAMLLLQLMFCVRISLLQAHHISDFFCKSYF